MRKKQLYNYLPEPNITPINISNRLENIKQKMPKLPKQIKEELKNSNVSENYIDILIADYSIFKVFDKISKATNNPTLTSS
jgi:Asp-tRNA(Asn)/Glu-tRNA(Gln) amidotransferase B subunit